MRHEVRFIYGRAVIDVFDEDGLRKWMIRAIRLRESPRYFYRSDGRCGKVFDYVYSIAWDEHELRHLEA